MRVVVAPNKAELQPYEICCFLAGGITGCKDWQNDVIRRLEKFDIDNNGNQLDRLVVFNPRRDLFLNSNNAAKEQIEWEFRWLQRMDIFSMFFADSESDQPICMYELGRNLCKMMTRFPDDYYNRIVITCSKNYKRAFDVQIQTQLAFLDNERKQIPNLILGSSTSIHALEIIRLYKIQRSLQKT